MIDAAIVQREEDDRVLFEQRIAEGEVRVTQQIFLIEQLRARGSDTALAERLLSEFQTQLTEWHSTLHDINKVLQSHKLLEQTRQSAEIGGALSVRASDGSGLQG